MSALAELIASHVLILLAIGIVVLAAAVSAVTALVRLAARHGEVLWSLVDVVVPGHLWRPRTYLLGHLALGFLLALAVLAFAGLAEQVVPGEDLAAFDLALAEALNANTSPAWRTVFWYLTGLGNGSVIAVVSLVVLWLLLKRGHTLLALMWAISQAGAALLNQALKAWFARVRPDGADPALHGGGWSFPSGHAMGTLVLCGVGIYLLVRLVPSWSNRSVPIALLLAWPVVIGFSRMYLGVHYASDVIAGFLAGAAWVAVCVSGSEVALRRRRSGEEQARSRPG